MIEIKANHKTGHATLSMHGNTEGIARDFEMIASAVTSAMLEPVDDTDDVDTIAHVVSGIATVAVMRQAKNRIREIKAKHT